MIPAESDSSMKFGETITTQQGWSAFLFISSYLEHLCSGAQFCSGTESYI